MTDLDYPPTRLQSSRKIGGNCIEIEYGNHRLFLDAGNPLDADFADDPASLVPPTLNTSHPVDALLISHPHQDPYSLLPSLPMEWPVWCGGPAEPLMRLTSSITGKLANPARTASRGIWAVPWDRPMTGVWTPRF